MTADFSTIHEETLQIPAFECDFQHHWRPSAFFQHLSTVAGHHADRLGVGYEWFTAQNLFWVNSRMKIQFFGFPHPGDVVTLRTWPKTVQQKLFFVRDFEVWSAAGERLAAATSAWLVINATTRRLVPPQSLNLSFPMLPERSAVDEPLERLSLAQQGDERLRVRAGYSAVDLLGHVNNSRYIEWICDAFSLESYKERKLDWLQINYDHEILPGEEVTVLANPVEGQAWLWALEGLNLNTNQRAFEALVKFSQIP